MAGHLFPGPFEIKGSAVFGRERTLRLEIRRWWVPEPKRWAAWLMLNPSVAGENRNDPTAQRVTHFTRAWGYDGWIGVNLYPFISSKPAEMWRWANWQNHGPAWDVRDDLERGSKRSHGKRRCGSSRSALGRCSMMKPGSICVSRRSASRQTLAAMKRCIASERTR
jgi:hypothetical protein